MSFGRSILVFVGALIFSVLLWSYVRLSTPYEADVDLPVKLTAPKGFAVASGLPEHLHARVQGAGWQILLMNFTNNSRFQFDLAERAVTDSTKLILRSDELTHDVMVPSDVHLLKVDPDSLSLVFAKRASKYVPIVPTVDIETSRGYVIVGSPVVTPSSVLVEGAPGVLDSLKYFPTRAITVANAREDVDRTLELSDSLDNLITLPNSPKISLHVDVQAVGERVISDVPLTVKALPPEYDMLLNPATVSVTVRGGVDLLASLQASSIRASIVYDAPVFDTARTVTAQIEVPKGVTLLSSDPTAVRFIVRKKGANTDVAE